MAAVLSQVRYASATGGATQPPLDQGAVGNQTDVWPADVGAGRYLVPAAKLVQVQTVGFGVGRPARVVAQAPSTAVNCGLAEFRIGSTDHAEVRVLGASLPVGAGWEDITAFWQSARSLPPDFHDGITVAGGTAIAIRVTPAAVTTTVWRASFFGEEGGSPSFKSAVFTTHTTTADQVALTYTPGGTFTLKGWRVEGVVVGPVAGVARIRADGATAIDLGRHGFEESATVPASFVRSGGANYGVGAVFINLWGMSFYPGQSFELGVLPWDADGAEWQMVVMGNDADLGGGGTFPSAGDVRDGEVYGPTDNLTGTLELPAEADVRLGTGFGADGTEFTGTLDPGAGGGAATFTPRRGR